MNQCFHSISSTGPVYSGRPGVVASTGLPVVDGHGGRVRRGGPPGPPGLPVPGLPPGGLRTE